MQTMPAAVSAAEAGVRAELAAPAEVLPSQPARLVHRLADAGTGAVVTADFVVRASAHS